MTRVVVDKKGGISRIMHSPMSQNIFQACGMGSRVAGRPPPSAAGVSDPPRAIRARPARLRQIIE